MRVFWTLEAASGRIWATDKTKELFGFAPTEEFDLKKFLSIVHSEDLEAVRGTIERAIQSGEDSTIEYRAIRPDGADTLDLDPRPSSFRRVWGARPIDGRFNRHHGTQAI